MLSRIADSMYWMARYLERAGETARLMEINLLYLVEAEEDMGEEDKWRPILEITASFPQYVELYGDETITTQRVLQFICGGRTNNSSTQIFHWGMRCCRDGLRADFRPLDKAIAVAIGEESGRKDAGKHPAGIMQALCAA